MTKTLLIAAAGFLLAVSAYADDEDQDQDQQRCECTSAQKDWYRHHPHHNRIFGNVEKCCTGFPCHCLDRW